MTKEKKSESKKKFTFLKEKKVELTEKIKNFDRFHKIIYMSS